MSRRWGRGSLRAQHRLASRCPLSTPPRDAACRLRESPAEDMGPRRLPPAPPDHWPLLQFRSAGAPQEVEVAAGVRLEHVVHVELSVSALGRPRGLPECAPLRELGLIHQEIEL